jgi:hypothetical protein
MPPYRRENAPIHGRQTLAGTATIPDTGFALTWRDTAPVYWRLRATRAKILEAREELRGGEVER